MQVNDKTRRKKKKKERETNDAERRNGKKIFFLLFIVLRSGTLWRVPVRFGEHFCVLSCAGFGFF